MNLLYSLDSRIIIKIKTDPRDHEVRDRLHIDLYILAYVLLDIPKNCFLK